MTRSVYLVNVGANTAHGARARSPVFDDGTFVYVPFPAKPPIGSSEYSSEARPFVRAAGPLCTHADPDWDGLTYGDLCSNPRALALRSVSLGDILLFWGLLWRNVGEDWTGFRRERGWYLLGALAVEWIIEQGESLDRLDDGRRDRASKNAHFKGSGGSLPPNHRVFLGDLQRSRRFARAVDLEVERPDGLLYRAFAAGNGQLLTLNGKPSWSSSLRACRRIWDLSDPVDRARATLVRDAVLVGSGYDMLEGV